MSVKLLGRIDQSLDQGEDWHRNYKIKWLIETDDTADGPYRAMNCPGLPAIGSEWRFGNDNDPFAFCWPNWTVSQFNSSNHEPNTLWVVEQSFSTKFSMGGMERVDNPFSEPAKISGTFVKFQEEKRYDYEGKPMHTMSFEPFRGKLAEFDDNRPTVSIEMNYSNLGLNVFPFLIDHVNQSPMWGLGSRMVKLSNVRWTRNIYRFGYFYTRSYDFEVNFKTFDRIVPEVGTKKLVTLGVKTNPLHWVLRRDEEGNVLRNEFYYQTTGHDWDGVNPTAIAKRVLAYYPGANFFVLGIPASF
jgi:hypothetical protein